MNKTVVKVAGLGALALGGFIFALFAKDEKEALSAKGIKEWAEHKVEASRSEKDKELIERYEKAKQLYDEDTDRIKKSINDRLNEWKKDTGIDKKIEFLEANRERNLEEYRKSVRYDEKIKEAYKKKDEILKAWENDTDYSARKNEIEESLIEAKADYERGKKALELISNDTVKDVSKKVLKEEYKKRCDKLNEAKAELKSKYEEAALKAEKETNDIINPIKEAYRAKKAEIDKLYSGEINDLQSKIDAKREGISIFVNENRSEVSKRIEKHYEANKELMERSRTAEDSMKIELVENANEHTSEILYYNLQKKGWSKWALYLFEGILPVGVGCGLFYVGYKCIKWGIFNIQAIHAVTSES